MTQDDSQSIEVVAAQYCNGLSCCASFGHGGNLSPSEGFSFGSVNVLPCRSRGTTLVQKEFKLCERTSTVSPYGRLPPVSASDTVRNGSSVATTPCLGNCAHRSAPCS